MPVVVDEAMMAEVAATLPELPQARKQRLLDEYELTAEQASVLLQDLAWADYFEATVAAGGPAQAAARWITTEMFARANKAGVEATALPVAAADLARLLVCISEDIVSNSAAKDVLAAVWDGEGTPDAIIEARGLRQVGAGADLDRWVDEVLAAHPDEVEQYKGGKDRLLGFFVGQVMQASGGKADPKQVGAQLREKLAAN